MRSTQSRAHVPHGTKSQELGILGLMICMDLGKPLNILCLSPPTMQIFIYLAGALVEINELFVKHFEDEKHYKNAKYYYV